VHAGNPRPQFLNVLGECRPRGDERVQKGKFFGKKKQKKKPKKKKTRKRRAPDKRFFRTGKVVAKGLVRPGAPPAGKCPKLFTGTAQEDGKIVAVAQPKRGGRGKE